MPTIQLQNNPVQYALRLNRKSRSIRVTIHPGGEMVVSAPHASYQKHIENFLEKKAHWILEKLSIFRKLPPRTRNKSNNAHYREHREQARELILARLEHWSAVYGFSYRRVSIKNQKTRWGSCSKDRNLNFNYKLLFLPGHLRDYIIVHEICHLRELNHGKRFWNLVEKTIPNHRELRKELHKRHHL